MKSKGLMKRKYTYKPHIVLIRNGKKTRSSLLIEKLISDGLSFGEAEEMVVKEWSRKGIIRGNETGQ